jgi:hypothetical protein
MSKRVDAFLSQFHDDHRGTREQTIAVLGEDESLAFEALTVDAAELLTAVEEHYGEPAFTTSLVGLFLPSLVKEIQGMQFDFLNGRYPEVGRTVRVQAEKMARAFFIDVHAQMLPGGPDHPGTTNEDKLNWYEINERRLSGKELTAACATMLIRAPYQNLRALFDPLWNRLHETAHPSAAQIRSGFEESRRHVFNSFDEPLAQRLLADAAEVFALVWGMVMLTFPKIVPDLATQAELFRHAPKARLWLNLATAA